MVLQLGFRVLFSFGSLLGGLSLGICLLLAEVAMESLAEVVDLALVPPERVRLAGSNGFVVLVPGYCCCCCCYPWCLLKLLVL